MILGIWVPFRLIGCSLLGQAAERKGMSQTRSPVIYGTSSPSWNGHLQDGGRARGLMLARPWSPFLLDIVHAYDEYFYRASLWMMAAYKMADEPGSLIPARSSQPLLFTVMRSRFFTTCSSLVRSAADTMAVEPGSWILSRSLHQFLLSDIIHASQTPLYESLWADGVTAYTMVDEQTNSLSTTDFRSRSSSTPFMHTSSFTVPPPSTVAPYTRVD